MGATQASAGVLAPYIEAREGSPLLDLTTRSLDLYENFMTSVRSESGINVPYRRTGTIEVAFDDDDVRSMQATLDVLTRRRVHARLLDAAATAAEEPLLSKDAIASLVIYAHGFVAAGELTRALVTAARRHGAQLVEQTRVRRIVAWRSEVTVETGRGSLTANAVVIAAGSWSGEIVVDGLSAKRLPVRPVRGQLLYAALEGASLRRVTWGDRCYMVPWDDGTVLVGATVEEAGFDERVTFAGVRDLIDAACDLVPHAWAAAFRGTRVGLRPATSDELPVIGPSRTASNVIYATGHYRNGILLAPLTAQLVADALENRLDPMLASVSPSRFGL
jgi:glycine oxidase